MAITCKWETVLGTVSYQDTKLTLYGGGNVFACICYDEHTENGTIHHLYGFICDKDHLKRILENVNHYNEYSNWFFNAKYNEVWQIAKILTKHGHEVTIANIP